MIIKMSKNTFIRPLWFVLFGLMQFMLLPVNAQDEGYMLSGTVSSFSGKPLGDISVSIEGLSIDPVITDSMGNFNIKVPGGKVWVLVSPVDKFKSKRIFLNNRRELNVFLTPKDVMSDYDEVTLLTGKKVRRNVKGSVVALNKMNESYPYTTIGQEMQGKIPGVFVTNNSGMPGTGTFTNIRGLSGLYTNQQPLYIIDGIFYENPGTMNSIVDGFNIAPLSGIDLNDIVSVSVLKDASSLAFLGTRGSKGVILIETLRPTETTTRIDVSAFTGMNLRPEGLPVLKSSNFRTLAQDILQTSGKPEELFKEQYPGLYDDPSSSSYFRYNHETDWQNEVFRNAVIRGMYASVRGGDEIGKYGLSVGFSNAEGIIKSTDYTRFSIRFVGALNIFEWLRMNVSTNLNYTKSDIMESGVNQATSPVFSSLFKAPFMNPYQYSPTGQKLLYLDDVDILGISNPTAIVNEVNASDNAYRFIGSFRFTGDITEKIKWNTVIGLNFNALKEEIFLPDKGMVGFLNEEAYNLSKHKSDYLYSLQLDNNLGYESNISDIQKVSAFVGMRLMTNHLESDIGISANTPSDEYTSLRYGSSGLRYGMGNIGNYNWLSYYGNVDYSLLDRYYLGLNVSLDGSSRVGEDADLPLRIYNRPFGVFPSASLAWRISDENILKNISWLEEFKFRTSYGLSGNDDIGNYSSRQYYRQVLYRETTGLILGSLPNTALKNETYSMFNAGLDLSLFGSRVIFTADYYNTKTTDLFVLERQEDYLGYEYLPSNNGVVRNKGKELTLMMRLVDGKKFKWDTKFNASFNSNNVTSLKSDAIITNIQGGQLITTVGENLNSFYGLVANGVYSTTGEAMDDSLVNEIGSPFAAGDIKFMDISGPDGKPDGIINEFDKTIIGCPSPDIFGGFLSSFYLGKWSLEVFIQFVYGNEVFNYLRSQTEKMSDLDNQSTSVLRRWEYEGQITDIPRASWNDQQGNNKFSSRWIEDGSYLRLKNVTLAYTIPHKFLAFQNARFYVSASNLLTLTKYLGYDPEFSYAAEPYLQGIDYGIYPASSSFVAGVKFGL